MGVFAYLVTADGGWRIVFGMGQHESYHITNRVFCIEARSRFYSVSVSSMGKSRISAVSCLDAQVLFCFRSEYDTKIFGWCSSVAYAKRRCWYSRPDRYSPDLGSTQEASRTNNIALSHLASTASCIVKIPPSKIGFSFTTSSQSPAIFHIAEQLTIFNGNPSYEMQNG